MANVVFTEPAEYDLLDIEYYIFVDLKNLQASESNRWNIGRGRKAGRLSGRTFIIGR